MAEIPGNCTLNIPKSLDKTRSTNNGRFFLPVYEVDEQAQWWGNLIKRCMVEAQNEIFGIEIGAAKFEPAPFWNH